MHNTVHCSRSVVCIVCTLCACSHMRCARSRARSHSHCALSRALLHAVEHCHAHRVLYVVCQRCSVVTRSAAPASSPVATQNFLSQQTLLSSLSRQRRIGPLSQHRLHVMTQGLHALSKLGRDTAQGRDPMPRVPYHDREPPVATLVTQSQPQPCCNTEILSRHGVGNFCHARM